MSRVILVNPAPSETFHAFLTAESNSDHSQLLLLFFHTLLWYNTLLYFHLLHFPVSRHSAAAAAAEADLGVVNHVLTLWNQEIGSGNDSSGCRAFDGSFYAGTILETLDVAVGSESANTGGAGGPQQQAASDLDAAASSGRPPSSSVLPVASVLTPQDCQTIVGTIATLSQLQWIFQQHPTPVIFSLLSSISSSSSSSGQLQQQPQLSPSSSAAGGGQDNNSNAGRDYLLLKGVLEHGLSNELEFRIQGTTMTGHDVEDRIRRCTRMLFQQLQELKKKEVAAALKGSYRALLGT